MPADCVYIVLFLYTGNSARSVTVLPVASLDRMSLQGRLGAIGALAGASLRKPDVA